MQTCLLDLQTLEYEGVFFFETSETRCLVMLRDIAEKLCHRAGGISEFSRK